jgi:hypothetical protein
MARPIKDTLVLKGKDAKRFREAIANPEPISQEEREEQRKAYEFSKSRAKFYMP